MSLIEIFQIDAFTDKVFYGNPAAVCFLDEWLNDELMQAIAVENNLSETAFVIQNESGFHIRWFTPNCEIDLCGHATLAAGFALFETGRAEESSIEFHSHSGSLLVQRAKDLYTLDFPAFQSYECKAAAQVLSLIDKKALEIRESSLDYLVELATQAEVREVKVDLNALNKLNRRGLIVTAKSSQDEYDFYSRCFYPKHEIPEDPVTGSAHCILAPYWSEKLNKTALSALQGKARGGKVLCEYDKARGRVYLTGNCKWYLKGQLVI